MKYSMRTLLISFLLLSAASLMGQVKGEVVKGEGDCSSYDHIVIETRSGFVFAEVYTGSFDEGDIVYGDLHSYGFKNVKVGSRTGRIYIDNYFEGRSGIEEWCGDELQLYRGMKKITGRHSFIIWSNPQDR